MTKQGASPATGWRARVAACAVLAVLALAGVFAPAGAAQRSCPPGLFSNGGDKCLKSSERSTLPLDDRQPMRFELWKARSSEEVHFIQGIGTITPETPAALKAFLATRDGPESRRLSLHSPGGDLAAALELGEIIRQAGLSTYIGREIRLEGTGEYHEYDTAECGGACALAFLGGVARFYEERELYGLPHLGRGTRRGRGFKRADGAACNRARAAATGDDKFGRP